MTGRQIADNLAESRLPWVKEAFIKKGKGKRPGYCVLGVKLHEFGVSDELLSHIGGAIEMPRVSHADGWNMDLDELNVPDPDDFHLGDLVSLNDRCSSKQELIEVLRSEEFAKKRFRIEDFRKSVLAAQNKLEKRRAKAAKQKNEGAPRH